MDRVSGRGRTRERELGDLVHRPDGRSPFAHAVRLGLGMLAAAVAVVVLLPAILVQDLLRRGRRKTLLVLALLTLVAGVMALRGEEQVVAPPVVRPTQVRYIDDIDVSLLQTAHVVVHRSGEPAQGLRVRAWKRGLEGGHLLGGGQTDAQGVARFDVTDLDDVTLLVDRGDGRLVATSHGESLDLDAIDTFSGTVAGPLDEGVIADVSVWLGALRVATTRADRYGAFRLDGVQAPGAVVVVTAPGFVPTLASLDRGEAILRLRRGEVGSLGGTVFDEHGYPATGGIVRALRGERVVLTAAIDDHGRFAFPELEAGAVTLEVHRPNEQVPALRADARVLDGDPTSVDLQLQKRAELSVVVHTPEGQPLAGAAVRIVDPAVTRFGGYSESRVQPERTTGEDGVAFFQELPAGRYFVRATVPGRDAPLLGHVELGAGTTVMTLEESTRALTVRVVDEDGAPVSGVFMDVSMPGINWHDMPSARTDSDGVATFEGLPAGLAEVHLGKGDLWRMVRAEGDEATFVWTQANTVDLQGRITGYEGEVLVASVLADVVHMSRAYVGSDGALDTSITLPAGEARVFLIAHDRRLAPLELGEIGPGRGLRDVRASFVYGARVSGRLVDAETGRGVPGRVRFDGAIAGALEAQTQWLGGTDHDEWITVNEWSRATGPDGVFVVDGVPAGARSLRTPFSSRAERHTIRFEALGAEPRTESLDEDHGHLDLGDVPLEPR